MAQKVSSEVRFVRVGELGQVGTGSSDRNHEIVNGEYPFYVRSKEILRIDTFEFDEEAIIIPGEGGIGEIFHYVNGRYALHQRAYRIHFTSTVVDTKFAFYYFSAFFKDFISKKAVSATVTSIRKPMILDFEIPIPPMEVQLEIVRILDAMTSLQAELQAELEARRKQYEYYRDTLLNFTAPGTPPVRWMTLGELADLNWGDTSTTKSAFITEGVRYLAYSASGPDGFLDHFDNDRKAVVLSAIGALAGKTWLAEGKWSCIKNTIRFFSRDETLVRTDFLYWWTSTPNFWPRRGSAQPFISKGDADKVLIPVPSLEVQDGVVDKLRNFHVLISDIQVGLPAEIEARRKQYEYYRDKLITFEELAA